MSKHFSVSLCSVLLSCALSGCVEEDVVGVEDGNCDSSLISDHNRIVSTVRSATDEADLRSARAAAEEFKRKYGGVECRAALEDSSSFSLDQTPTFINASRKADEFIRSIDELIALEQREASCLALEEATDELESAAQALGSEGTANAAFVESEKRRLRSRATFLDEEQLEAELDASAEAIQKKIDAMATPVARVRKAADKVRGLLKGQTCTDRDLGPIEVALRQVDELLKTLEAQKVTR